MAFEDQRNLLNRCLNPLHTLFFGYQLYWQRKYRGFFDTVERNPLTKKQREAIVLNERRNLVVAGAGTGKTSTVLGKVGYLVKSGRCRPEEILVIAYNSAAAQEAGQRLSAQLGVDVHASTFHALGKRILKESNHPSRISPYVDQPHKFHEFLEGILDSCLADPRLMSLYAGYFAEHEFPGKDERDFRSLREYAAWVRANQLRTFGNEIVKSHGEWQIANFLYRNGVRYEYEAHYSPGNPAASGHAYRPDFHLPDIGAYIEYFGVDERGNTAPYIDAEKYRREMEMKRGVHRANGTDMIELFYHQKKRGVLLEALRGELRRRGVALRPLGDREILRAINQTGKSRKFVKLVDRFLMQYKEARGLGSLRAFHAKAKARGDRRTEVFLTIFSKVLGEYQRDLERRRSVDFGDMISVAASLVRRNAYVSGWKYIIVDEFQDISAGRLELVRALLDQSREARLFCVGDDWQAIYRFAGSDHAIMRNFRALFGKAAVVKLDMTFRFNSQIARTSERFICKNPGQIRKRLRTLVSEAEPQVFLHCVGGSRFAAIQAVVERIESQDPRGGKSLQILCRYNMSKLSPAEISQLDSIWTGVILEQRTVHASKGLEADYVIVADLSGDSGGFPSDWGTDPILNLVLPPEDRYPHGEERRLFYVALTRARSQAHLIADWTNRSEFAEELRDRRYGVSVTESDVFRKKCPDCADGEVVSVKTKRGLMFRCCNHPVCRRVETKCPECEKNFVERRKLEDGREHAVCLNAECAREYPPCNLCDEGFLIRRAAGFLGCSAFPRTRCRGGR